MIALVDCSTAEVGYEFIYLGRGGECKECRLREPCHHNLEAGRRYAVTEVTDALHPCALFNEVAVCHVREVGIDTAVAVGTAFEGSTMHFQPLECDDVLCDSSPICTPEGLRKGDRCVIEKIKGRVHCPRNRKLQMVTVRRT